MSNDRGTTASTKPSPNFEALLADLRQAQLSGDDSEQDRIAKEFYNIEAQLAKERKDNVALYLLALIEDAQAKKMFAFANVCNRLLILHKLGVLNIICSDFLAGVISDVTTTLFIKVAEQYENQDDVIESGAQSRV